MQLMLDKRAVFLCDSIDPLFTTYLVIQNCSVTSHMSLHFTIAYLMKLEPNSSLKHKFNRNNNHVVSHITSMFIWNSFFSLKIWNLSIVWRKKKLNVSDTIFRISTIQQGHRLAGTGSSRNWFLSLKVILQGPIQHLSCNMTKPTKWVCAQQRLRSAWASS